MWYDLLLLAIGTALIIKGSDFFVDASVDIAGRAGLPRVVIGGTLVSLATTTPELTVSIFSGIEETPGLAIGNALGSVVVNIALILALIALFRPLKMGHAEYGWRAALLVGLTVLLFVLTLDLSLPQWRGLILLAFGIAYVAFDFRRGLHSKRRRLDGQAPHFTGRPAHLVAFFFGLGAAMVIIGSRLLVSGGIAIAEDIGVRPIFVGLTLMALGTSLPELATAITSARKKVSDLSVGNLLGANVLNLTIVTGSAAAISPLSLAGLTRNYTLPAVLIILTVFYLFIRSRHELTRRDGAILIGLYAAYIAGLIYFYVLGGEG